MANWATVTGIQWYLS